MAVEAYISTTISGSSLLKDSVCFSASEFRFHEQLDLTNQRSFSNSGMSGGKSF